MDAAGLRSLQVKFTERYCVVYQTIRSGPPVAISMQRT